MTSLSLRKKPPSRFTSSGPTVFSAMNLLSRNPSCRMTLIIPRASAPSVPGLMGMCSSARAAVAVKRGSITTTLAPFLLARTICLNWW